MVSWACNSDVLSDKKVYSTLTRISNAHAFVSPVINGLMDEFNWTEKIHLVQEVAYNAGVTNAIERDLVNSGKSVVIRTIKSTVYGSEIDYYSMKEQEKVINEIKDSARIIVILMFGTNFRNFLITCNDFGMLNGDYVFVGYDIGYLLHSPIIHRPDITNHLYDGVLNIAPNFPSGSKWIKFAKEVVSAFQHPAFKDVPHLGPDALPQEVDGYAGMVHDAVLMWGYGVNKTISQGHAPSNGPKVTENIFNLTFDGITGKVVIDDRGDRKPNYRVEMFQNQKLVTLMVWDPTKETMRKIFRPNVTNWSGLLWPSNQTEIPRDSPPCGWTGELCESGKSKSRVLLLSTVVTTLVITGISFAMVFIAIRKVRFENQIKAATTCLINWNDVEEIVEVRRACSSLFSYAGEDNGRLNSNIKTVRYKNQVAAVKPLGRNTIDLTDRKILVELKSMKEIHHDNLNTFLGICLEVNHRSVLMAFAPRGSLQDVLLGEDCELSWDFKLSIITDLATGMDYLHSTVTGCHGHLTSHNCLVDSRWVTKITDYGLQHIKAASNLNTENATGSNDSLLWTAPEILRLLHHTEKEDLPLKVLQRGDVFSFSIVCQEIIQQTLPYGWNHPSYSPEEIIMTLKAGANPVLRPDLQGDYHSDWISMIESCWLEDPDKRPNFSNITRKIQALSAGENISLVDKMILRLEYYTTHLEEIVEERSEALRNEKAKMEQLLQELLPKSISNRLMSGRSVAPELYDSVTIFFSDVVGFTRISAAGTAIDVVEMLNLMYTLFDNISTGYDVYKVATIGDAYFVASGVPESNGDRHAAEICQMALSLLEAVSNFEILHLPQETLKLRIGIHSGPCVAGVAGIKMPRYLLFGDTIDIASIMESSGESMKIHISPTTKNLLDKDGQFVLVLRGTTEIQGLGETQSYWLTDYTNDI